MPFPSTDDSHRSTFSIWAVYFLSLSSVDISNKMYKYVLDVIYILFGLILPKVKFKRFL